MAEPDAGGVCIWILSPALDRGAISAVAFEILVDIDGGALALTFELELASELIAFVLAPILFSCDFPI